MSRKFLVQCILAASLAVGACGEDDDGGETTGDDGGTPGADAGGADAGGGCDGLTYEKDTKAIFATHCTSCHGAMPIGTSVKLDSLTAVKAQKENILKQAIEPRQQPVMPLGGPPIPADQQAKLKKWLECGAP